MKSYWSRVACDRPRDKEAILSWFSPFCDDMIPEKAEVLCDVETDREKKFRVLMVDKNGRKRWAIRTFGSKAWSFTLKPVKALIYIAEGDR